MSRRSSRSGGVGLDEILITDALGRRTPRPTEPVAENRALHVLARLLAERPDAMLKALAATALELCRGGSAGVSLLQSGECHAHIRRSSVAGAYERYEGGSDPFPSSPSGDCLERRSPQLYSYPARYFASFRALEPLIIEVLVVPLISVDFRLMGTIWVASHEEERRFDSGDLRVMKALADFAIAGLRLVRLPMAERRLRYYLPSLAHQFRNPLAQIRNTLDQMTGGDQGGLDLEALRELAEAQVARMAGLVDDVLEFERMAMHLPGMRRESIDLAELVRDAVDRFRRASAERRLDWNVTIPDEPIPFEADPDRLGRALGNLLDNAVRYNDPGGRIWLEVESERDAAVIRLRNTGCGINPDMLSLVFEPFVQMECSPEHRRGGLGIGLAHAKAIIERHGGGITARSEGFGRDSEFIVRLPAICRAGGSGQVVVPLPSSSAKRPRRRILIVDGSADTTRALVRLLGRCWGHEVRVAHDGPSALEEAKSLGPEFVLLSLGLLGTDGYELARQLRTQANPAGMLLVALLRNNQMPDMRRLVEAGFDHHFVKPIDVEELENLLTGAAGPGAFT